MTIEYKKLDDRQIAIVETSTVVKKTTYTYDFILNKLQELAEQTLYFTSLKSEADKFNLKR